MEGANTVEDRVLNQPLQCSLIALWQRLGLSLAGNMSPPTANSIYCISFFAAFNQARIRHVSPDLQTLSVETWSPINP